MNERYVQLGPRGSWHIRDAPSRATLCGLWPRLGGAADDWPLWSSSATPLFVCRRCRIAHRAAYGRDLPASEEAS